MRIFLLVLVVFLCGCAALMALTGEGKEITSEEVRPLAGSFDVLLGDMVPQPYRYPAAYAFGWISALLRRLYKKKKGCLT